MPVLKANCNRTNRGTCLAEFGASLAVFVCFLLVPAIAIASVPARYVIGEALLSGAASDLAVAQTRKEAFNRMQGERPWKEIAGKFGINIQNPKLTLVISSDSGADKYLVKDSSTVIPAEWLPKGAKKPGVYFLELEAQCDLNVPCFNKPVSLGLRGRCPWENLSRDPATGQYYINE